MNILYLVYFDVNDQKQTGVKKKIQNQVHALQSLGHKVLIGGCRDSEFYIRDGSEETTYSVKYGISHYRYSVYRLLKTIPLDCDVVYTRFPGTIDLIFYNTLRILSKRGLKVVLELPTYPIGNELIQGIKNDFTKKRYLSLITHTVAVGIHRVLSRNLKTKIYKIVTYMPYDKIWGVKTIQIDNGVDTNQVPAIDWDIRTRNDDSINMIVVANVSIWHGIDRLIRGIKDYYSGKHSRHITLSIIGDSPLCSDLKSLSDELGLQEYIFFKGSKFGNELRQEYEKADIAIGSLGMHRINVLNGSTLKVKEYCSLGIPFVYAYNERCLDPNFPYALKLQPCESNIDIEEVIDFYNKVLSKENVSEIMHQFAEDNFTWEKQMKAVVEAV